jgi:hypothetical protein
LLTILWAYTWAVPAHTRRVKTIRLREKASPETDYKWCKGKSKTSSHRTPPKKPSTPLDMLARPSDVSRAFTPSGA